MTKLTLEEKHKIILEAIKIASADEPRRAFTKKDKEGRSVFAMLPYTLLFNRKITMMDVGVYAIILGYCQMEKEKKDSVRLSQRKIAEILGTNSRIVSRSILNLESLDWLKVERHFKTTSTYWPQRTETPKAREIRLAEYKPKGKKSRLQKAFLKDLDKAEEAREKFLHWFSNLPKEEAIKFYKEHVDEVDYIVKEDSEILKNGLEKNLTTKK